MHKTQINDQINGWLIVHKPVGMSSARCVAIVKSHLKPKKIGHAGTLDPLASGVLPLALGEATKTMRFFNSADKSYEFTVRWGQETDTLDREGAVVQTSLNRPTAEQIESVLGSFVGQTEQVPPSYSAIKINGKRSYQLARQGGAPLMQSRPISIYDLTLDWADNDAARFRVSCGKGTYVRSLARDIAYALGTVGHVIELVRTRVGKFTANDTILLEKWDEVGYKGGALDMLLPIDAVLDDIPVLAVSENDQRHLRFGQSISCAVPFEVTQAFKECSDERVVVLKTNDHLIGFGRVHEQTIVPMRLFNL